MSPSLASNFPGRMLRYQAGIPSAYDTNFMNPALVGLLAIGYWGPSAVPPTNGMPLTSTPANYQNSFAAINIMQGTVPTDFSTLTSSAVRSSDILCSFPVYQDTTASINPSNAGNATLTYNPCILNSNPCTIGTTYVNAVASGTATWFWWRVLPNINVNPYVPVGTIIHQIIGDVGVAGSSAVLQLPSTSIVSGQPYRIQNFQLAFPTTWTY